MQRLNIQGYIFYSSVGPEWLHIRLPEVRVLLTECPNEKSLLILGATLFVALSSIFLSERFLPFKYYLRIIVLIQLTNLFVLWVFPSYLPISVSSHIGQLFIMLVVVMVVTPVIYALTYYVFDFALRKKLFLTLITLIYFLIFIPFFVVFHIYVLVELSVLLLPIMYFIFGIIIPVVILIAFYGWGMSWATASQEGFE